MKIYEWINDEFTSLMNGLSSPVVSIETWLEERMSEKITGAVEQVLEDYEHEATLPLQPFFDEVLKNPNIPDSIRKIIVEAKTPQHFATATILLAAVGIAIVPAMGAAMSGGIEQVRQGSMQAFKPTLLNPDEAISAMWRGKISHEDLTSELNQHGFNASRQANLEAVRRYIPNSQDLIRFTIRDVFRDDVVKKYGYDEGYEQIEESLKSYLDALGMDSDVMRLFWRAHWELPSIGQAFDMLHRGEIEIDEIRDLLRIADVAPAWVEPIIKIAYSPYTRVDVRRMYESGILDRDAVYNSYTDLGYDAEHAENMTSWTVAESMSTEKDLTKTEILTAYQQGAIQPTDALEALGEMGYDEDESGLILEMQDYRTDSTLKGREKGILVKKFAQGTLSVEDLKSKLSALGLPERENNITVEEALSKVKEKVSSPTKADLKKWFSAGVLSKEDYIFEMRLKGYSQKHIDMYVAMGG